MMTLIKALLLQQGIQPVLGLNTCFEVLLKIELK